MTRLCFARLELRIEEVALENVAAQINFTERHSRIRVCSQFCDSTALILAVRLVVPLL